MISDPRTTAIDAIETAVAHLAEALEELDRMPTGQAAIGLVGHALNNYLSVSDATLDLLSNTLRDHPDPEVATWIAGLRHLGNMMQHTTDRLVSASSPSGFPLRLERIDLAKLMARACQYYTSSAAKKGLAILFGPADDVSPAWGDRVAIAVVADNLLSNAVKYSKPDGEIIVQILTGPGGVVCSVRDNGPGLTAVQQGRLFQRGARRGPTTPAEPASGYGLSIARELVERMGGQLWFENSSTAVGGSFLFRIPYPPVDSTPA